VFRAAGEDVSEDDEMVVPRGFWKNFLTSKFTFEDAGSDVAGEVPTVCAVDSDAVVEPAVDGGVIEVVDEEALEVTTDDLDDMDALPLTRNFRN
jgi:hypothetical protein